MTKIGPMTGASAHTKYQRPKHDYYATDPNAIRLFLDQFEADGESLANAVWEPACGEGNLVQPLKERGHNVFATDLIDRNGNHTFDFLNKSPNMQWCGDVLTNPPYKQAQAFVETALARVEDESKVIMLLRIQFLESQRRHIFFKQNPPKYVYVHSSRIQIRLNNDPTINGSALCFAWFVWEKGHQGDTVIRWIE